MFCSRAVFGLFLQRGEWNDKMKVRKGSLQRVWHPKSVPRINRSSPAFGAERTTQGDTKKLTLNLGLLSSLVQKGASNLRTFCLHPPGSRITDTHHHLPPHTAVLRKGALLGSVGSQSKMVKGLHILPVDRKADDKRRTDVGMNVFEEGNLESG